MKNFFDTPHRHFPRATDWIISVLAWPCAVLLRSYRRLGSARLPQTTRRLRTVGIFPLLHYYSDPLFNPYILPKSLDEERFLPGIDFNVPAQLALLDRFQYADELRAFQWEEASPQSPGYRLNNGYFGPGDADFLYQFLRTIKPRRMLEVGSGYSTRVARLALEKNTIETGQPCEHRCIEPYESDRLGDLTGFELIPTPLEDCAIDWRTELAADDLLFIDSSHIIRPQGDVLKEYLEILPQLPSGVFVHIHDIFTPRDYPSQWLLDDVLFWNEQYLLEALLSGSHRYQVIASLNFLKHHHEDQLNRACPYLTPKAEPGSFYIRIR